MSFHRHGQQDTDSTEFYTQCWVNLLRDIGITREFFDSQFLDPVTPVPHLVSGSCEQSRVEEVTTKKLPASSALVFSIPGIPPCFPSCNGRRIRGPRT